MPVHRLNHVVLYVREVARTKLFYEEVFGFRQVMGDGVRASFLQAPGSNNDHDLGIFGLGATAGDSTAGRSTVGMYHVAWEVNTLRELSEIHDDLIRRGCLVGASNHGTTKALYGLDPDGLEFEVSWIVPAARIDDRALSERLTTTRLDLAREMQYYGAETLGGLGVSIPLGVLAE
ncbi:MAG: VOC family protein [Actinomycetota bacterium]